MNWIYWWSTKKSTTIAVNLVSDYKNVIVIRTFSRLLVLLDVELDTQ